MPLLHENTFPPFISSGYEDPLEDLFIPALRSAKKYDVGVGYFTSGWLAAAAPGFIQFARAGGVSRWVVSPNLNPDDAICLNDPSNYANVVELAERSIEDAIQALKEDARRELCYYILNGTLDFKIAIPRESKFSMFHAKFGIFDDGSDQLAFTGSYNLTVNANSNWEQISIYRSWDEGEKKRIQRLQRDFESLWNNEDRRFATVTPSGSLKRRVEGVAESAGAYEIEAVEEPVREIVLRDYQESAVTSWGRNRFRGVYALATGSGKTITALSTIEKLRRSLVEDKGQSLIVVVVLPLKHLLDQWAVESGIFGYKPLKCYESSQQWEGTLARIISSINNSSGDFKIAMVTNATFGSGKFQAYIREIKIPFMLVVDEMHNLGSKVGLASLPENANCRLGLSATPDRHNDEEGTAELLNYFGGVVAEFSLADAIERGFLTPYRYIPHFCPMSDSEYEEYVEIAQDIQRELDNSNVSGRQSDEYYRLVGRREDLIAGVESKISILERELILQKQHEGDVRHTLVYCGSRRGEDQQRHIERIVSKVGYDLGIKARKFTAQESMADRRRILADFSEGRLELIAAIKCLDEGVDVPATKTAYILSSTSNPREYVQRRGRVLRLSEGKEIAVIHDFLVTPPSWAVDEYRMVELELDRAREFNEIAINGSENQVLLGELEAQHGV